MDFLKTIFKIVCVLISITLNITCFQIVISKTDYNMFIYTMHNINDVLFDSQKIIDLDLLNVEQKVYIYNNTYSLEEPLDKNGYLFVTYKKTFDEASGYKQTELNLEQFIKKEEGYASLKINNNINNGNNINYNTPIAKSTFNFFIEYNPTIDSICDINPFIPLLQNNFLNKVYQKSIYSKNYWGNFSNNISYNYLLLNLNEKKTFKILPDIVINYHRSCDDVIGCNIIYYSGFNNYLNKFMPNVEKFDFYKKEGLILFD